MKGARVLACVSAVAAVGCLWLFPIQEEETKTSSSLTGMDGSTAAAGAAGTSAVTENDAGECTVNEDCGGQDSVICRAHTCVTLPTNECPVLLGNWSDPHAFIFGAYSFEPPGAPEKWQAIYNYDMAIRELNAAGGLPDRLGTKHPLAAVVCNNDPSQAAHQADSLLHLVDDIGVSAIVADLPPDALETALATTQKKSKSVFLLSPGAANKKLIGLLDNGLVWNMIGPPSDLADGYEDLVRRMEKYVRARSDAGTTSLRVAVVLKDDPSEADHELFSELYTAVETKLSFNGAQATDPQNAANYRVFHIDATKDAGAPSVIGDAVNDFAPHIVISMTGADFTKVDSTNPSNGGVAQSIVTRVKGGDPSRDPWVQHEYPFFIFSPVNAATGTDFSKLLTSSTAHDYPVLFQRFLGINIAGADDRDVLADYQGRLRTFQKAAGDGFENYYDSIYYLAYAVYAAGVEPIDGKKINGGMISLNGGKPEKVGPLGLIDAVFQALNDGPVLLSGAGGSKFDVTAGARIDKAGIYCFQNINSTIVSHQPAEIFDPDARTWRDLIHLDDAMIYPDPCAPGL